MAAAGRMGTVDIYSCSASSSK